MNKKIRSISISENIDNDLIKDSRNRGVINIYVSFYIDYINNKMTGNESTSPLTSNIENL